ncbi:peptide deformylase [bacterium]|nr:peptide deformylase [bacterium]
MSLLNVLKYPDKRLKNKSKPVIEVNKTIRELAESMMETMYVENGIGLAAPQIGENIRLIVVDVPIQDKINEEKYHPDPVALINPEIITGDGKIQYEEGCLSCPELIVLVDRQKNIVVKYLDLEGRPQELKATDLKAVCIQHEIDHLNGTLLADRLSSVDRDLYKTKRIRIAKDEKDLEKVL